MVINQKENKKKKENKKNLTKEMSLAKRDLSLFSNKKKKGLSFPQNEETKKGEMGKKKKEEGRRKKKKANKKTKTNKETKKQTKKQQTKTTNKKTNKKKTKSPKFFSFLKLNRSQSSINNKRRNKLFKLFSGNPSISCKYF